MGIIFKADGMYLRNWEYDEDVGAGQDVDTRVRSLFDVLNDEVEEIEPGVTFRQLVRCCFPQGINKLDLSVLDMVTDRRLTPFLKELEEKPPKTEVDDGDPLTSLEIYVSAEADKYHKDTSYRLGIYLGIHGFGTKEDHEHGFKGKIPYALSYSHWGTFADVPVTFNPETEMTVTIEKRKRIWKLKKFFSKKRRRHYQWRKMKVNYHPTLIEFLHDVFTDLAFCGSPEGRSDHNDMLEERMDEVDSGKAELVPLPADFFEVEDE